MTRVDTPLLPVHRRKRLQVSESETSKVYKGNFRTARSIQRNQNTVLENKRMELTPDCESQLEEVRTWRRGQQRALDRLWKK